MRGTLAELAQTPGQSARPGSPFYTNLAPLWGEQEFFPLALSSEIVEENAAYRMTLSPAQ